MPTIQFDSGSSTGKRAIVVSFDLCGFSDFCNNPEAYSILPKFISAVFEQLDSVFIDGLEEFLAGLDPKKGQAPAPKFIKYTGDGAIMIWFPPTDVETRQKYCTSIVAAMRSFRQRLVEMIPKWEIEWQVDHLPHPTRFGIAAGLVHPLKAKSMLPGLDDPIDYAGYCINLAVRLQDHCPEVGFIIHELVFPKLEGLVKYIAHGMKGARSEPVLMFVSDIPGLPLDYLRSKFQPCGEESELRCQVTQREFKMAVVGTKETPAITQPRFQAHLVGPGDWRQDLFLGEALPEWVPIMDIKDNSGKIIGKEKYFYKLKSKGPPLIYEFVRKEPWVDRLPT